MNCRMKLFLVLSPELITKRITAMQGREFFSPNKIYQMKKILLLFFVFSVSTVFAQKIEKMPQPAMAVNDFGNFLAPFQKDALEQKLRAYNDSTSSAIVIIT